MVAIAFEIYSCAPTAILMSLVLDVDQVLAIDTEHEEWEADWAEIRIDFAAPDDSVRGAYEARVEVCGSVTSAWTSGDEESIYEAKQYRVSHLVNVV